MSNMDILLERLYWLFMTQFPKATTKTLVCPSDHLWSYNTAYSDYAKLLHPCQYRFAGASEQQFYEALDTVIHLARDQLLTDKGYIIPAAAAKLKAGGYKIKSERDCGGDIEAVWIYPMAVDPNAEGTRFYISMRDGYRNVTEAVYPPVSALKHMRSDSLWSKIKHFFK